MEGFSGLPYLYYITFHCAEVLVLLQDFVLGNQHLNSGGKPATVEVVFQEVKTVIIVKIVEDSDNKHMRYNGTHIRTYAIPVPVCVYYVDCSPP